MSFADVLVTQKSKGSTRLEKIETLINWKRFNYRLEKILKKSSLGRPAYPALSMFKALILQNLYSLSDPEIEEMLYDRLSFRRFCGFGLQDSLPDETTICRFRNALVGHSEQLFHMVLQDIKDKGLELGKGAILDASIIQSRSARPNGGGISETDPDAGWTKKRGTYHHGYKLHIAGDDTHGLLQGLEVTSADIHDSLVFNSLISEEDEIIYADKAYDTRKHHAFLEKHNIKNGILRKSKKGKKQPAWQRQLNGVLNKTRCKIERCFAHLKGKLNFGRSSYFGLEKVKNAAYLKCLTYNLMRAQNLIKLAT